MHNTLVLVFLLKQFQINIVLEQFVLRVGIALKELRV